jgi:hypothetical protein
VRLNITTETRWLRSPYVGVASFGAEVDIVKCLVVNTECFVRALHKLVNGKHSVIKLHIAAVEKTPNWEIK